MEITLVGLNFETKNNVEAYIKEKLSLISRKVKKGAIRKIHFVIKHEGEDFLSKVDIVEEIDKKAIITASEKAGTAHASIDLVCKNLEEQIIRHKEKIATKHHKNGVIAKETLNLTSTETLEEVYEILDDDEI